MADVPKDLVQEIKRLEDLFTVDSTKLKAITKHFVSELTKGMCLISQCVSAFRIQCFSHWIPAEITLQCLTPCETMKCFPFCCSDRQDLY